MLIAHLITNDRHRTAHVVRGRSLSPSTCVTVVSPRSARLARAALCGVAGCTCSSPLGARGRQQSGIKVELRLDGGVSLY